MTPTPKAVREWLDKCDLLGEDPIVPKDAVLAAADAWEADEKRLDDANDTIAQLHHELVALRKRLEAAEKDAFEAGYIRGHEDTVEHGGYHAAQAAEEYVAALAGEEK